MKMLQPGLKLMAVLFIALAATACAPAINLAHVDLPHNAQSRGQVEIGTIKNLRLAHKGGDSFSNLGNVRGGFGNPFDLETSAGREIDVSLRDALQTSLASAGYASATAGATARRIDMDVLEFWCDGYGGYKVTASVMVKVIDTSTGKVLAEETIKSTDGFMQGVGYGNMQEAFDRLMNKFTISLAEYVKSEKFQSAVSTLKQ